MGRRRRIVCGIGWVAIALVACVDAEHASNIAALGPEAPGVPPGPLHRPGQPCLVCHGPSGPSSTQFSVAGTIYATSGESAPAPGAQVQVEDILGSTVSATTNSAGNFYVTPSMWSPTYPTIVTNVSLGQASQLMLTHIGREGSCAGCHFDPVGPSSPGHVYLQMAQSDGGP